MTTRLRTYCIVETCRRYAPRFSHFCPEHRPPAPAPRPRRQCCVVEACHRQRATTGEYCPKHRAFYAADLAAMGIR